jgi:hypothetical protein
MHLNTVYMGYYGCLPTLLNPLAERACFSQVVAAAEPGGWGGLALGSVLAAVFVGAGLIVYQRQRPKEWWQTTGF